MKLAEAIVSLEQAPGVIQQAASNFVPGVHMLGGLGDKPDPVHFFAAIEALQGN